MKSRGLAHGVPRARGTCGNLYSIRITWGIVTHEVMIDIEASFEASTFIDALGTSGACSPGPTTPAKRQGQEEGPGALPRAGLRRPYVTNAERPVGLPAFVDYFNHDRLYSTCWNLSLMSRVNNVPARSTVDIDDALTYCCLCRNRIVNDT